MKNTFVIGFMLFAIFFGAGNLIFPPKLGLEMGQDFWLAIMGFILTGVGLPLLTIIVGSFFANGYKQALDKISPHFSVVFLVSVYLALGPGFGIPRTAATAYDLAISPLLEEQNGFFLFLFSAVYFCVAVWLSLNPSKMVGRVGAVLTPVLLLFIFALIARSLWLFADVEASGAAVTGNAFAKGIIEGYFTMDILAAMAFSVIVISAVKAQGSHGKIFTHQTVKSAMIAALLLTFVYVAIGWIGNKMPGETAVLAQLKGQNIGTFILNVATEQAFGPLGKSVLACIVILACLTSAVGLITAISQYFSQVFRRISYRNYVLLFSFISFILANRGLDAVISTSVPVLLILYPIAITVLIVLLGDKWLNVPMIAQRCALLCVSLVSVISVLGEKLGLDSVALLPFKANSMEWIPFLIIGLGLGYIIHRLRPKAALEVNR
ncbi:branched-chain amino acid transport system II carrier protein [Pasteurellaceae bacterium LIM206]|nr:branched-chain amino acid transport system II carrier protein [Pasteurellaceae bacterium LIM206]